jgi:hypothetical protein
MSRRKIQAAIKAYEDDANCLPIAPGQDEIDHVNALACHALTLITQAAEKREKDEEMLAALMKVEPGQKATTLVLPELGEVDIRTAHLGNVPRLRRAARATYAHS